MRRVIVKTLLVFLPTKPVVPIFYAPLQVIVAARRCTTVAGSRRSRMDAQRVLFQKISHLLGHGISPVQGVRKECPDSPIGNAVLLSAGQAGKKVLDADQPKGCPGA